MGRKSGHKKNGHMLSRKGARSRPDSVDLHDPGATGPGAAGPMKYKEYRRLLRPLHGELVALQEWVKSSDARICIVFEGRDTAGKGGVIRAITERVGPRVFRVVALPAPTEREKSQMYVQRYLPHLPAGGAVGIFDRSWYNRAGVERVMGFCTEEQVQQFLHHTGRSAGGVDGRRSGHTAPATRARRHCLRAGDVLVGAVKERSPPYAGSSPATRTARQHSIEDRRNRCRMCSRAGGGRGRTPRAGRRRTRGRVGPVVWS